MATAIEVIAENVYSWRGLFCAASENKGANFDREAGFAIQIMSASDYAAKLAMGDWASVQAAVINVAAIGISLNPAKKQAYLVPRKGKICLDISYMGLIDLAVEAGSIFWAQAAIVREHDVFALNGFDKPPTHTYSPFAKPEVRGEIVGAYVVVKTHDGDYLTHPMEIGLIHETRNRSEAWKKYVQDKSKLCPWVTDEMEMIKKTVVKQAYKYWPKTERTSRIDNAIHLLNTEGEEGFSKNNNSVTVENSIEPNPELLESIRAAADKGRAEFDKSWATLNKETRLTLKNYIDEFKSRFRAADNARTVDAPSTPATVSKTFDEIMVAMCAAKDESALYIAGDWIDSVGNADDKAALDGKFDELLKKLRGE